MLEATAVKVGRTDVFERRYTQKFNELAGEFGEFVEYKRDRGARDVGLHLTYRRSDGSERVSSTMCWFQLKGIMAATLPLKDYRSAAEISLKLEVEHLRFWYLQPMPTYLALYVESADEFLVLNLKEYVERKWGMDIFLLAQKQVTVPVSRSSLLDRVAFQHILRDGDAEEWAKRLSTDHATVRQCLRDYEVIYRAGTARERNVEHRLSICDWQSKLRTELSFEEREVPGDGVEDDEEWECIREHWELQLPAEAVEESFPYLALGERADGEEVEEEWGYEEGPVLTLNNGVEIRGKDFCGETHTYNIPYTLSPLGWQMFEWVRIMGTAGIIDLDDLGFTFVDVAPWHYRDT